MENLQQNLLQPDNPAQDKYHSSQNPTRHPTTTKKQQLSPESFKRSQPTSMSPQIRNYSSQPKYKKSTSLYNSLLLQSRKQKQMRSGAYGKALKIQQRIKRTKSLLSKIEMRKMKNNQIKQKQSIKRAYLFQIKFFENAWSNYFQQFKQRQDSKIVQFHANQRYDVDNARQKLRRKCYTLKNTSRELNDLQKQQEYYMSKGNVVELKQVSKQVKKQIEKTNRDRQATIIRWTKVEEKHLEEHQQKKYSSLLKKLQGQRTDQQQLYLNQKKRLKQKYKNVLSQLKHEQRMTMQCFINNRLKPLQSV